MECYHRACWSQFASDGPALLSWPSTCLVNQQNKIILDPLTFSEARFRPSLEERLESIISGAALMADSSCTRDDRRERIVAECNAVRQALQDLLSEYMNNVSLIYLFDLIAPLLLYTVQSWTDLNTRIQSCSPCIQTLIRLTSFEISQSSLPLPVSTITGRLVFLLKRPLPSLSFSQIAFPLQLNITGYT